MANLCVMGVDPGISGAIAFFFSDMPELIAAEDIPVALGMVDAATLARRVEQMRPDMAVVERVGAMPKQGVSSTFRFGQSYGLVLGVLAACGVPVYLETPVHWKRHYRLPADKEASRAKALQLWPARAELFEKKKHHGRAEAALLARFGADVYGRTEDAA